MIILNWPHPPQGGILSLVIILGTVLAIIVNGMTNAWLGILLLSKNKGREVLPRWLAVTNAIFFVFQLIYMLK